MSCSSLNRDNDARAVACDAQPAHQRLGAVVARPHADAELVEHLGQVVRVHVPVGQGEHAAAVVGPAGGPKMRQSEPSFSSRRASA